MFDDEPIMFDTSYNIAQRRAKMCRLQRKVFGLPSDKAAIRKVIEHACKTNPIRRIESSKRYA
jgi:hypothetical protein